MRYAWLRPTGLNARTLRTQAVVLHPEMITKLIEQPGRPWQCKTGGRVFRCRPSLSDMVSIMNHEVSALYGHHHQNSVQ